MIVLPSSVKRITIVQGDSQGTRVIQSHRTRSPRRKKGPAVLRPMARAVEHLGKAAEVTAVDFRKRVRRSRRDNGSAFLVEAPMLMIRSQAKGLKAVRKHIPSSIRVFIPRIEF